MTKGKLALVVGLIVLGVGLGIIGQALLRVGAAASLSTFLEPRELKLVDEPLQGDKVIAQLMLTNRSRMPLTVTEAAGGCRSCMEITTSDGQLTKPIEVAPNESIPWKIRIDTVGRQGPQAFAVVLKCVVDGSPQQFASVIKFNVRMGLLAVPAHMVLDDVEPGKPYVSIVEVLDGAGESPLLIDRVISSAPNRLHGTLERLDDGIVGIDQGQNKPPLQLRRRYRLTVSFRCQENLLQVQDNLILHPVDKTRNNVEVPVIVKFVKPPYRLSPSSLAWDLSAKKPFRRMVLCRCRDDIGRELKTLSKPSYVDVTIAKVGELEYQITVSIPRRPEKGIENSDIIIGAASGTGPSIVLPIRVLSGSDNGQKK